MEIQEAINTYIQSEEKRMSLGTSTTNTSQQVHPYFTNTGRSSISGSSFSLDPTIERLRQQATQGISQAGGQYGSQLSQLQQSAFGNLPDYVNAQLAPLQQSLAQQKGNLQQELSQRRLLGSSFATQSQDVQNIDAQRALAAARAQAIAGGVGQAAGLAGQQFQGAQGVNQALQQAAQQRLLQELGIFGLGTQGTGTQNTSSTGLNLGGILGLPGY